MKVLSFGIAREIIGKPVFEVTLNEVSDIRELRNSLYLSFPELKSLQSLAFAVNEEYATDRTKLNEEDTIALIPPVSGG